MNKSDAIRAAFAHFTNDKGLEPRSRQIVEWVKEQHGHAVTAALIAQVRMHRDNPGRLKERQRTNREKAAHKGAGWRLRIEAKLDELLALLKNKETAS